MSAVDVWIVEVSDGGSHGVESAVDLLTPSEQIAAERRRHGKDRSRSLIAQAALRRLIATRTAADPEDVLLGRDERGRPVFLGSADVWASIAHSGDFVACAAASRDVGIDIDRCTRQEADDDFAVRVCAPAERRELELLSVEERRRAVMRLWVRKEAFAKALGDGLAISPGALDVTRETPVHAGVRETRWRIRDIQAPEGYVAAVAARGSWWRVRACLMPAYPDLRGPHG